MPSSERIPISDLLIRQPDLNDCLYVVAVDAAIYHAGRYLLIQRSAHSTHAAATLAFPGGKVEGVTDQPGVLEAALLREALEETGVTIASGPVYVSSQAFVSDDGKPVIDLLFLCRWEAGTASPADPDEVDEAAWMTLAEALADRRTPSWTRRDLALVERKRLELGW